MSENLPIKVEKLEWDSTFFGCFVEKMYVNDLSEEILNEALFNSGAKLIYVQSERPIFSKILFSYCGTKVIFEKAIKKNNIDVNINIIDVNYYFYNTHLVELRKLALLSGEFSRFKLDVNLRRQDFQNFYDTWIANAFYKTHDNFFIVYQDGSGNPIGLLTAKTNILSSSCQVGLFAVSQSFQKQGIGACLLERLEMVCFEAGITTILIPTQLENIKACNFYKKMNYTQKEVKYIYHYWK